jgi:BirA family transcriptional regulator, biotin operon repressor / biotin---[acetyl-CoA-carboxylase] ligase
MSELPQPRAARALGAPRVHFHRTSSTNERARELAVGGAPQGTLVTASEQTAGHGRHGRLWWAPPGSSLLMSLILRDPPALLPLAAAVAVCDTVGTKARIKWPNDVVIERPATRLGGDPVLAKLAGILIEGRPQEGWVVLGIGINVAVSPADAPAALREGVASLGEPPDAIEPLLERLLGALEVRLRESTYATIDAWRARDVLRGHQIAWRERASAVGEAASAGAEKVGDQDERELEGRAEGIDGAGRLIVKRLDGRRTTLEAGEVHLSARSVPRAPAS